MTGIESASGVNETLALLWVRRGALLIELLAVAMTLGFILAATAVWLFRLLARGGPQFEYYMQYRRQLARALLIGLEILVAADIVRTVALEPDIVTLLQLGLLVIIRTFLTWSIVVEIEGRWPWQPPVRRAGRSEEDEL